MTEAGVKAQDAYRTISEVAEHLDLPQHVLRFWESKFPQIKPLKRSGNRRYYRPQDVETLTAIQRLLHDDGYTIRGVQKLFRENGLRPTIQQVLHGSGVASGHLHAVTTDPIADQTIQNNPAARTDLSTASAASSGTLANTPKLTPKLSKENRDTLIKALESLKSLRQMLD